MKKFLLPAALFAAVAFTSCGGGSTDPLEIDVKTLEEPCQCADAALSIAEGMNEIYEAAEGNEDNVSKEDMEKFEKLEDKMNEVEDHCRKEKEFSKDQMMECESFKKAMEIMEKID